MAENLSLIHIWLLGPIADGGCAQQGGGAVDGHGVRTAHAMTARITDCLLYTSLDGPYSIVGLVS